MITTATFSVAKAAFPFFLLLNVAVVIITAFPEIVTAVPNWVFPETPRLK
jgi:C4-dicarboxylate transporter, DctM subunit